MKQKVKCSVRNRSIKKLPLGLVGQMREDEAARLREKVERVEHLQSIIHIRILVSDNNICSSMHPLSFIDTVHDLIGTSFIMKLHVRRGARISGSRRAGPYSCSSARTSRSPPDTTGCTRSPRSTSGETRWRPPRRARGSRTSSRARSCSDHLYIVHTHLDTNNTCDQYAHPTALT
jgi:hypothetical protein